MYEIIIEIACLVGVVYVVGSLRNRVKSILILLRRSRRSSTVGYAAGR